MILGDLLIRHARLWDGTGAPVEPDAWVQIAHGEVVGVGREPYTGAVVGEVLDAGGRAVIPGLIDSHTHPAAIPGADLRGDDEPTRDALRRAGLAAYLASGVTTVLDTGVPLPLLEALRAMPGPRYLTLGPVLGPPDGYVDAFLPGHTPAATDAEVVAHLDRLVAIGAVGVKLTVEEGYLRPVWPLHTPALRATVAREAAARGLPVYVHAMDPALQAVALDQVAPRAFLHLARDPDDALVARIAASAWQVTTMTLWGAPIDPQLDDPWVRARVPEIELQTARTQWAPYERAMARISLPRLPEWLIRVGAAVTPITRMYRKNHASDLRTVRRMHEAGVRLVVGSDAAAFDVIPYFFHGVSTVRELEWLVEAGLTPEEALRAATREPAAMLGLDGELGVIAPGAAADLVVLDADPLADVRALRQVWRVVQGGVARAPEEILGAR